MKSDLTCTMCTSCRVHISTSNYIINNYLKPQITLWCYKQTFIQPFTPTVERNSTCLDMHISIMVPTYYCQSAALLYVNHKRQMALHVNGISVHHSHPFYRALRSTEPFHMIKFMNIKLHNHKVPFLYHDFKMQKTVKTTSGKITH